MRRWMWGRRRQRDKRIPYIAHAHARRQVLVATGEHRHATTGEEGTREMGWLFLSLCASLCGDEAC